MLSIKVLDEGVIRAGVFTVGKKEFEQMVSTCFTIFFTIWCFTMYCGWEHLYWSRPWVYYFFLFEWEFFKQWGHKIIIEFAYWDFPMFIYTTFYYVFFFYPNKSWFNFFRFLNFMVFSYFIGFIFINVQQGYAFWGFCRCEYICVMV